MNKLDGKNMEINKSRILPNITAYIDLLGFSNFFDLSANDLRTPVGELLVKRLDILEDAVAKINKEKIEHPELYPPNLYIKKVTDSITISADIDTTFLPKIGEHFKCPFSVEEWRRTPQKEVVNNEKVKEIGCFIGAVARIHQFINQMEVELFFPGCRTVIASGLRLIREKNNEVEDMLSNNFAFTNAWKLNNETGTKEEREKLKGNNLFITEGVAAALRQGTIYQQILRISKFHIEPDFSRSDSLTHSGDSIDSSPYYKLIKVDPFEIHYNDYSTLKVIKLNHSPLTFMQIIPNLDREKIDSYHAEFLDKYYNLLEKSDEGIINQQPSKNLKEELPLSTFFPLDMDIGEWYKK